MLPLLSSLSLSVLRSNRNRPKSPTSSYGSLRALIQYQGATDSQKNDTHIYLVMEFCSGSDLSVYIKNRGRLPTLDFVPRGSMDGDKMFWPHPPSGGLDERVTRCFLGQLSMARSCYFATHADDSARTRVSTKAESDPSGYQAASTFSLHLGSAKKADVRTSCCSLQMRKTWPQATRSVYLC